MEDGIGPNVVEEIVVTGDDPERGVVVPGDALGRGMQRDIDAVGEGLLAERCGKGRVDEHEWPANTAELVEISEFESRI